MPNKLYLHKRNNTYYFRQVVPSDIQPILERVEIKKSLGTSDPSKAKLLASQLAYSLEDLYSQLRGGKMKYSELKAKLHEILADLIQVQVKYIERVGPKSNERVGILWAVSKDFSKLSEVLKKGDVDAYSIMLSENEQRDFIEERISRRLHTLGEEMDLATRAGRMTLASVCAMLSKFYEDTAEMHEQAGSFHSNPPVMVARPQEYIAAITESVSPNIREAFASYADEKKRADHWRPKTEKQVVTNLNALIEICGERTVGEYGVNDSRTYKNVLRLLPGNINKIRARDYPNQTLADIAELDHDDLITPKTVNSKLTSMSAFFGWLVAQGYIDDNIFSDMRVPEPRAAIKGERPPYSHDELIVIKALALLETPAWRKWLVLMGMFTGARLNEICQLYLDDIILEADVPYLTITGARDDQSLKNPSSERQLPIHSHLIEMGFEDFVALRIRQGADRLFPEFKHSEANHYSHKASKWFNRTFKSKLLGGFQDKVFHSFRHSFATLLQRNDVPPEIISQLLGHGHGSVTLDRYADGYSLDQLRDAIEQVRID